MQAADDGSISRKRRTHSKSRRGCLGCKRRHYKCDEARPTCGVCTRLGENCHYATVERRSRVPTRTRKPIAQGTSAISPQSPRTVTESADSTPPIRHVAVGTPSNLEEVQTPLSRFSQTSNDHAAAQPTCTLDLELMANALMGDTLRNLSSGQQECPDFLRNFVQLALATPYLLHEMLAVCALRLFAAHSTREELITRASYHQNEALALVRPDITSVPEERALPLLLFSSLAAISALAEAAFDPHKRDDFDPIAQAVHAFRLGRGIMAVVAPHWSYIHGTWAGPIIRSDIEAGSHLTPSPQSIPTYIMLRSLAFGIEPPATRKACLKAVDITLCSLSLVRQSDDASLSRRLATAWPIECDAAFHSTLAEHKPVSLIILAHYAALLRLGSGLWWAGDMPYMLLESIDSTLGKEWEEFLAWPKGVILGN